MLWFFINNYSGTPNTGLTNCGFFAHEWHHNHELSFDAA